MSREEKQSLKAVDISVPQANISAVEQPDWEDGERGERGANLGREQGELVVNDKIF